MATEVKDKVSVRNKFKKFGGERIPDVIEYIKDYINKNIDEKHHNRLINDSIENFSKKL